MTARLIRQRNLRGFGVKLPPIRLLAVAYSLPILITGPMFVIAWAVFGWFDQGESGSVLQSFLIAATAGVLATALIAIGEELGWRGYLVPEMAKIARFRTVALASGAIWAIWHWPLILLMPQISGFDQLNPLFAIVSLTLILTGAGALVAVTWVFAGLVVLRQAPEA